MDGKSFAKMAKDCKVISKSCTTTDIDLIFAKVKDKSARRITFAQFENAIEQCATKNKVSNEDLVAKICSHGGPTYTATKAQANKFHDDKSQYTGVHAKGGPSTVDNKISDLSQLADRSDATVRGVKK